MKAGDILWFVGIDSEDDKEPAQFATCTGRKFSGYVCATLASGRHVVRPQSCFRNFEIDAQGSNTGDKR